MSSAKTPTPPAAVSLDSYLERGSDVMNRLQMGIALVAISLLLPFAINNFIQERWILGVGSAGIVSMFAFNAWSIKSRRKHYPNLILFGLVPAVVVFLTLSIARQGFIGVLWAYPAALCYYFMLPPRQARIANLILLIAVIPLILRQFEAGLAARMVFTLLMVSTMSTIFIGVIGRLQQELQHKVETDPLTGLLNRVRLIECLASAIHQQDRSGLPVTLATLDLDNFKSINDQYGHDAGDLVLQQFAALLKERSRKVDRVFRLGGEEFLITLYNTGLEAARTTAEEIRKLVESTEFLPDHQVTVSIGLATFSRGDDWRAWMRRSDQNLYRAKQQGRNRVVG